MSAVDLTRMPENESYVSVTQRQQVSGHLLRSPKVVDAQRQPPCTPHPRPHRHCYYAGLIELPQQYLRVAEWCRQNHAIDTCS